jgi:hypothetical protein
MMSMRAEEDKEGGDLMVRIRLSQRQSGVGISEGFNKPSSMVMSVTKCKSTCFSFIDTPQHGRITGFFTYPQVPMLKYVKMHCNVN